MRLESELAASGLAFRAVDIWDDPSGAAYVRSVADGRETVPTVDIAGHALVEPSMREVLAAVAEHATHLLASDEQRPVGGDADRSG